MTIELSMLIALAGSFVGMAGWLAARDRRMNGDAEWRGQVNAKLDTICGLSRDIGKLEKEQKDFGERLAAVESAANQALHRLDGVEGKLK